MNLCTLNQRALAVPVAGTNPAAPTTPARLEIAEGAARIVQGLPPEPPMNRRDALRMAAFVAAYMVEQAAAQIREEL
jgi:hypothetical protein